MARHRADLVSDPIPTPIGSARIVSRVDTWSWGPLFASRHRATSVEITDGGLVQHHPVADPGLLVAAFSTVFAIFRRRP